MKFTYKTTRLSCYAGYISQAVINNFPSLLFVTFSRQFGLSLTGLASLITINFCTQILVDIFGARYVEKIGYRKTIVASQLVTALGLILMGTLPFVIKPYIGLIIATIVMALGSGLTEVMLSPIVESLPGDAKASAMSLLHSFYCWGVVYTILLSTLYFGIFGVARWRYLAYYFAILPLFTLFIFSKTPFNIVSGTEDKPFDLKGMILDKIFWIFIILMLCSGAAEVAMAQWASMFAETSLGVTKSVGDILGPCMFAVFMGISRVIFGKYGERLDLAKSMTVTSILCVIGYLVATLINTPIINLAGCMIVGFSVGIMWPGTMSLAARKFPAGGTSLFGLLALGGDLGCTLGPELVAVASEGSTLKTGLVFAIVFPIIIIILTVKNAHNETR